MNLFAGASQGGSPFDAGGDVNIQAGFARHGMGGAVDLTSGYSEGVGTSARGAQAAPQRVAREAPNGERRVA